MALVAGSEQAPALLRWAELDCDSDDDFLPEAEAEVNQKCCPAVGSCSPVPVQKRWGDLSDSEDEEETPPSRSSSAPRWGDLEADSDSDDEEQKWTPPSSRRTWEAMEEEEDRELRLPREVSVGGGLCFGPLASIPEGEDDEDDELDEAWCGARWTLTSRGETACSEHGSTACPSEADSEIYKD